MTPEEFEQFVFAAVKTALSAGPAQPNSPSWQVYLHKAYFSRDRHASIDFDVVAEYLLPRAVVPSLLWIWECKKYSGAVPVSDVEELHSKVQQIGEDNTKATIISYGPFQRSAVPYAQSKGIGVARLFTDGQIRWISHSMPRRSDPTSLFCDDDARLYNNRLIVSDSNGNMAHPDIGFFVGHEAKNLTRPHHE